MLKMCVVVANNYTYDSRVQRIAKTYSKKYNVTVLALTNSKSDIFEEKFSPQLKIKRYYVKWPLKNLFILLFGQNLLKKLSLIENADIYHCCDPDTMIAGVIAKNKFKSKIIYDSHELWSNISHNQNLISRVYSFVYSKLYYVLEIFYISKFDKVITVSEPIKHVLQKRYKLKDIIVVENRCEYIPPLKNKIFNPLCVYIGAERTDVLKFAKIIKNKFNWNSKMLGFKKNKIQGILFRGKIHPCKFKKELKDCSVGLCIYGKDSKSVYFTIPNKLFQYVQYELPIIAPNYPGLQKIKKYNVGVLYNDDEDFLFKFKHLIDNYDFYKSNILKYKYFLSWEFEKQKILK